MVDSLLGKNAIAEKRRVGIKGKRRAGGIWRLRFFVCSARTNAASMVEEKKNVNTFPFHARARCRRR